MQIYCCDCQRDIEARLTDGAEIYPHRPDLKDLPFWKCDVCKNDEQSIQFKIQILNFENAIDETLESIRVAMKELTGVKVYIG